MRIYRERGAVVFEGSRHSFVITTGFLVVLAIGLPLLLAVYFKR